MNREQMLAWLAIEGWQLILCRNDYPAFLKGTGCIFTKVEWGSDLNEYSPRWEPECNPRGLIPNDEVHLCDADAYSMDYLHKVIALIEKEKL